MEYLEQLIERYHDVEDAIDDLEMEKMDLTEQLEAIEEEINEVSSRINTTI